MARKAEKSVPAEKPETISGEHRNIGRAARLLSALAESGEQGLRFVDVSAATGFSKATTFRTLNGLVAHGLVEFDEAQGRYFLGIRMFGWLLAAGQRAGLVRALEPSLDRLAAETEDTIYLMIRTGPDATCIDRREGSFPIKTLTRRIGDTRPLGVGGAGLALLSSLPDAEVARLMVDRREERRQLGVTDEVLLDLVRQTRADGYSSFCGILYENMCAIGIPLFGIDGNLVAAISVAAIAERMQGDRRDTIVALLRREAAVFRNRLIHSDG